MLEVVQSGQAGKSTLLFDMHRLRKRVFKDRLCWDVKIYSDDLEADQFDLPETVYLLALNDKKEVIGSCRLLPTSGPNMIYDIWPEFLASIEVPRRTDIWESSRFAIDSSHSDKRQRFVESTKATAELTCGIIELCLLCEIKEFYTLYDSRIARLMRLAQCTPDKLSAPIIIDKFPAHVGGFNITPNLLSQLQNNMGVEGKLLRSENLPPSLQSRVRSSACAYSQAIMASSIPKETPQKYSLSEG